MTTPHDKPLDHEQVLRQAIGGPDTGSGGRARHRPPEPEELAPHFPDFEIQGLIGQGGMGAVYRAVQRKLGRTIALKVLPRELASEPEFGERFEREARALAALNHPHVLTVHDFGEADGLFYLVTEFVDGVNLRQLMELGRLSPSEALRITPQICQALQYAHEHGVVHRDVKPENILIDTNGQVKIADFGLAKLARPGEPIALTRSTEVFGTPQYMAPEQWHGSGNVDHRADIFSLGVVLYEMLTGQLPIGSFDPPSKRADVPTGLDQVVRRTLAQQPEDRYQSAREVETDVGLQAHRLGRGRPRKTGPAPRTGARLAKLPIAALAVLVVGLLGAAAVIFAATQQRVEWWDYVHANRAHEAVIAQMADTLSNGGTWNQPVPMPPEPATPPDRWVLEQWPWLLAACAGLVLLIAVLGFWSVHRVRAAGGGLRGMGLAVFTAWLVPLAIANALLFAPIANLRSSDARGITMFFAIPILAAGTIAFLVWQRRRQLAFATASSGTPARNGPFVAGVVVALALLGGAGATAALLPPAVTTRPAENVPMPPAALLGKSRDEVLARLGPPLAITASRDSATWSYRDVSGVESQEALVFGGDHVLSYDPDALVLMPNDPPDRGPHLGQAFADLVEELGPPSERSVGSLATEMVYAGRFRVTVLDGVIVGVSADR